MHSSSTSGGIWNDNDSIVFISTTVSGNTAGGGNPDLDPGTGTLSVNFSLIGTGITPDAGTSGNNVFSDAPLLGLLADNGGPTETHVLLANSPAIDAGDPSAVAGAGDVPLYDQRGFAYFRVVGASIDMGAIEEGVVSADFDEDSDVDGGDFLAWQRGFRIQTPIATKSDGDADNDLDVDEDDLTVWEGQFGTDSDPLIGAASMAIESAVSFLLNRSPLPLPPNRFPPSWWMQPLPWTKLCDRNLSLAYGQMQLPEMIISTGLRKGRGGANHQPGEAQVKLPIISSVAIPARLTKADSIVIPTP